MAIIIKEIVVCDLCEKETDGFIYNESTVGPFGVVSQKKLAIDICKACAYIIKNNIPEEMMTDEFKNLVHPVSSAVKDKYITYWKEDIERFKHNEDGRRLNKYAVPQN